MCINVGIVVIIEPGNDIRIEVRINGKIEISYDVLIHNGNAIRTEISIREICDVNGNTIMSKILTSTNEAC